MRWLVVLVAACSGANPPRREPAAALAPEQFCDGIGRAPPALARCTPEERALEVVGDVVDHLPLVVAECRKRIALVAAKRVAFDAAAGARCLAGVEEGRRRMPFGEFPARDCTGVMTGLVAVGQPCNEDFECADNAKCNRVCIAAPVEHAACATETIWFYEVSRSCGPHLGCRYADLTCAREIAPGEPCTLDGPCAGGGRCADGRCAAPRPMRAVGEVCARYRGHDVAMLLDCTPDAYCPTDGEPAEARCVAKQHAGTACQVHEECLGRCTDGTCTSLCGSG